jgi:hypothetical protein
MLGKKNFASLNNKKRKPTSTTHEVDKEYNLLTFLFHFLKQRAPSHVPLYLVAPIQKVSKV